MSDITTFPFNKVQFNKIKDYKFGQDWPVVYMIENGQEIYIGETSNAYVRSSQHFDNPERSKLNQIHLITDEEYNKSATMDIEAWLIEYISADGIFNLQNGNSGLRNHNYYDREKYKAKFELIWQKLKEKALVKNELIQIKNSNIFKYSPYKSLTDDQIIITNNLYKNIIEGSKKTFIINGQPGTGKTILAIYLIKYLKEQENTKDLEVGLVIPMTSLRGTLRKVFSKITGLKSNLVIGPNDVAKKKYDLLIVDEAHRLKRRINITNYRSFDETNKVFGLNKNGTELDWIMKASKQQIFFYDKNQSVRPSDIPYQNIVNLDAVHYNLISQVRISAGEQYINFIDDLFDLQSIKHYAFPDYDFKIYNNIHEMVSDIKQKDKEFSLSRVVAGYAWPWITKNTGEGFDIEINGLKLVWNKTNQNWVNSPNAINEVGCIHTVQGYDLNYVGVIIGPELSYDDVNNKLVVDIKKYMDINGKRSITSTEELKRYIINIYKTLLTRGINGTYIYIVDKKLAKYFKNKIVK